MSMISAFTSLFSDSPDASLAIAMSALSGVAMALAVTLALAVYIRSGRRSRRDVLRHALAGLAAVGLFAFVAYDTHHAALAYLGLNPSKPAVAFEIRLPREALAAVSDSQIELHTDRNQTLAQIEGARDLADGRAVLSGAVALDYRTAERMLVVNLPGRGTFEFKLRLAADPARSEQFGPWHLADRVASPVAGRAVPQDAFAIRYRVL
jgi:hypothetical protein